MVGQLPLYKYSAPPTSKHLFISQRTTHSNHHYSNNPHYTTYRTNSTALTSIIFNLTIHILRHG